jgi:hypothetical protein
LPNTCGDTTQHRKQRTKNKRLSHDTCVATTAIRKLLKKYVSVRATVQEYADAC